MTEPTLPAIPARRPNSHKGDYGRVLVVAGSRGMTGAACLTTMAALRAGAGLVTLALPASEQPIAAAKLTSPMTLALPSTSEGTLAAGAAEAILERAKSVQVVALGPGLSLHPETVECVEQVVRRLPAPLVLDADGLGAIAGRPEVLRSRSLSAVTILTPHAGEYRRLDPAIPAGRDDPIAPRVQAFASTWNVVVALKTHRTIVTDGKRLYRNQTGNPGMATGGSGDVLTGVVAGLVAQGFDPFGATCLAVHLHGAAGDLARDQVGEVSLIADDILAYLPLAIRNHQRRDPPAEVATSSS